jgi:L-fuconolactonase
MADAFEVIDAQVHVWAPDSNENPWQRDVAASRGSWLTCGPPVTAEHAIGAMDAVGVRRSLLTSFPLSADARYEVAAVAAHPDRFGLVVQLDPRRVADPDATLARYRARPGLAAVRVSFTDEHGIADYSWADTAGSQAFYSAAGAHGIPVMLSAPGEVRRFGGIFARHRATRFVIDHLGLPQGRPWRVPSPPLAQLGETLGMARFDNVAVKLSGLPTLSLAGYPFPDVLPAVRQILDRYGRERALWASDFSRTRTMYRYAEALDYLKCCAELTVVDKEWLLGRAARSFLGWPRAPGSAEKDNRERNRFHDL